MQRKQSVPTVNIIKELLLPVIINVCINVLLPSNWCFGIYRHWWN